MLQRKQSLRPDALPLADFGPDENYNDSADIEWVGFCLLPLATGLSRNVLKKYLSVVPKAKFVVKLNVYSL